MPFRKLWNSIRGGSEVQADKASVSKGQTTQGSGRSASPAQRSELTARAKEAKHAAKAHRNLCSRIQSLAPSSILEVRVGDASRSLGIIETLTRKGHSTPIHFIAIDPFDSAEGSITLLEFHKRLRDFPVKAHLVPMPPDSGLDRVVRTFGQVDVILWGELQLPTKEQQSMLTRLSKPDTVMFSQSEKQWSEDRLGVALTSRAAA